MDQKVASEFIIERDVPIKRAKSDRASWRKYPFNTMEPGESFAVPTAVDVEKLRGAALAFGKAHQMKFTVLLVSREPQQYRCWRVS